MSAIMQSTVSSPPEPIRILPEQRVILDDVSWETYERLLVENDSCSGKHFAYDRGRLEIMVLSVQHEPLKHALALLVDILAEELGIDSYGVGSATFQRADLARGFEPDASFYFQHEAAIRGKKAINLRVDPPPDLVIEIDITHPSLNKFPIFAALGIPEVWCYDGERVGIFRLEDGRYQEQAESGMLPQVTGSSLTEFVESSQQLPRRQWLRQVRAWAQAQTGR